MRMIESHVHRYSLDRQNLQVCIKRINLITGKPVGTYELGAPRYEPDEGTFYLTQSYIRVNSGVRGKRHSSPLHDDAATLVQHIANVTGMPVRWMPETINEEGERLLRRRKFAFVQKTDYGKRYGKTIRPRPRAIEPSAREKRLIRFLLQNSGWSKRPNPKK